MIKAIVFDYGGVLRRHLVYQHRLVAYAAQLRQRGYVTAVLSNLYAPQTVVAGWLRDHKGFDPVIISSQVGVRKPQVEIYRIMLQKLGLPAEQCVFVDNKQVNLRAAEQLGFVTVHARGTLGIIRALDTLLSS